MQLSESKAEYKKKVFVCGCHLMEKDVVQGQRQSSVTLYQEAKMHSPADLQLAIQHCPHPIERGSAMNAATLKFKKESEQFSVLHSNSESKAFDTMKKNEEYRTENAQLKEKLAEASKLLHSQTLSTRKEQDEKAMLEDSLQKERELSKEREVIFEQYSQALHDQDLKNSENELCIDELLDKISFLQHDSTSALTVANYNRKFSKCAKR
jgi:hypothetical protein